MTYSSLAQMLSQLYTSTPIDDDVDLHQPDAITSFLRTTASPYQKLPFRPKKNRIASFDVRNDIIRMLLQNPYNSVRGRITHGSGDQYPQRRASMSAVRSLLTLVPHVSDGLPRSGPSATDLEASYSEYPTWDNDVKSSRRPFSDAETATQIAEGTLRAFRDIALDEAVELNAALRYWSNRWERPVLSWLEAGPKGKCSFTGVGGVGLLHGVDC